MIKDVITDILNKPGNSVCTRYEELVEMYFNRSLKMEYIKMTISQDKIIFKNSHFSEEISNSTDSDISRLFEILKGCNDRIYGSEESIYEQRFLELWSIFYSENTDVLIVPCYTTKTNIYIVCIKDFINLKNDYNMTGLNFNNTILDEFPVLYFTLKHCLYDYFFEHRDTAWRFIIGCGNMIQSVKIVNNIFQYYYIPGLELFQELSNMPYEGVLNIGRIDFIDKYTEEISGYEIEFIDKCVLFKNQGRVLRKYLQMSNESRHLIASRFNAIEQANQSWIICGMKTEPKDEILCSVIFQGNSKWSCEFQNEIILYNGTEYELHIKNRIKSSNQYEDDIRKVFDEVLVKNISMVINKIKEQSHGAMLIISEDARLEAERLGKIHRAIRIVELNMLNQTKETLLAFTTIDGAILMDANCICYSIGTILDGNAEVYSNLGRGARFNSAYTYIYNMKRNGKKGVAVVVSEDGMVNVITTENVKNKDDDLYRNIRESEEQVMYEEIMNVEIEQNENYGWR